MIVIFEYDPFYPNPIRDGFVERTYENIVKYILPLYEKESREIPNPIFPFSTENIFHRIRLGVASGEIDPEKIRFKYKGQIIDINKYGAIQAWPNGFCDLLMELNEQILIKAFSITKK